MKKKQDKLVEPISLASSPEGKKGEPYIREDGKRVRLVKKEDSKRRKKKKERKERCKEEAKRAQRKARREAQQQLARAEAEERYRRRLECNWGGYDWKAAAERKESILKEAWKGKRATKSDRHKRVRFLISRNTFVQGEVYEEEKKQGDMENSGSTIATVSSNEAEEEESEEETESEPEHVVRLSPYVQRASMKSYIALERANQMRRISRIGHELVRLQTERMRRVNKMK